VLLVPGYLAGDDSLRILSEWLQQAGYCPTTAGIRLNAGCAGSMLTRLEQRLEPTKERMLVIGQSRGGLLGRLLLRRRPDLISGLITLGSPLLDPLGVHPLVLLNVAVVGTLGSLGVPGLFSHRCLRGGACCGWLWEDIGRPLPSDVHFLSVYSRTDGIVDWRTCLDPAARHVEVDSSHLGMAVNPAVYRIIAEELRSIHPRT
jgi:pimeloyl-ACP methyl ester carboxylesterase